MKKINIINYGCGNTLSILRAFEEIGFSPEVTNDKSKILNSDFLILPGVGAFENAMNLLKKFDLIDTLNEYVKIKKKLLLGICLGMQVLFSKSFEMGEHDGLKFIDGTVERLNKNTKIKKMKIPHINWSKINFKKNINSNTLIENGLSDSSFYFVHSYMAFPKNEDNILAKCKYYDIEIPAIVKKDNIAGFQFHPEKSGKNGLIMLKFVVNKFLQNNDLNI
tara:strand:+ start:774 stop:1436 length:663 start_codon:yes stop_codon:yes gene_type:complete